MVLKKFYHALESSSLSEETIKEILKFAKRNSLHVNNKKHYCCPSCLKAHLTKNSKMNNREINKLLKCQTGHQGYYLDKERLIKL